MRLTFLPFLFVPLMVSGCSTIGMIDADATGSVSPASFASHQSADMFLGPVANRMDEKARVDYLAAQTTALDAGRKTEFTNQSIGALGTVTTGPSELAMANPGLDCRKYSSVVWVLGQGKLVEGDACREIGGTWKAMGYVAR